MLTIEGCTNFNCVQNVVKNIVKHNKKFKRIVQVVSQALDPRPKHDKIWA
jgi:hypothetical protein